MEPTNQVEWIDNQKVPYLVQGKAWVGYDNLESFTAKVNSLLSSKRNGTVNKLSVILIIFINICLSRCSGLTP